LFNKAAVAAVCLWRTIQDIGKDVHAAADAVSAETTLRLAYAHAEVQQPHTLVQDTEPHGTIAPSHNTSISPR